MFPSASCRVAVAVCIFTSKIVQQDVLCFNRWADSENHFSWELGKRFYNVPDIRAVLLQPTGFRLTIPDNPYIDSVTFHVNINKEFKPLPETIPKTTQAYERKRKVLWKRDKSGKWRFVKPTFDVFPTGPSDFGAGWIPPGDYVHLATTVDCKHMWSYSNTWVELRNNTTVHFYAVVMCADGKIRARMDQFFVVGQLKNGTLYIRQRNKLKSVFGYQDQ